MSFDAEDHVARVLEENPLLVVDSESSKWVAVHDGVDHSAPQIAATARPGSLFTVAWVLGISLGLVWVLRNGRTVFDQWQENVHRRANRRRHGIPDDDDRPFNVAYAAAASARREREEQQKKRVENTQRSPPRQGSEWARYGESVGLRQRSARPSGSTATLSEHAKPAFLQGSSTTPVANQSVRFVPEESSTYRTQSRLQPSTDPRMVQSYDWSNRRDTQRPEDRAEPQLSVRSSSLDPNSRRHLEIDDAEPIPAERRKHHELEETEDEDRSPKKSRVTANGDIATNIDAVWDNMPGGSRRGSLQVLKRGSKRHANEEADDDWEMSQDKRARKGANTPGMDDVDVDMDHNDSDADVEPARGTKRDREDAESVADSAPHDTDLSASQPVRKRRASRRDEPAPHGTSRGRKRDRSYDRSSSSGEEEEDSDVPAARHKRGRRLEEREEDSVISPGDVSESEPEISSDPACGGRRVGETWEVNGQSFKVGLDGRRLRHALIKQSRTKFPMPKDSAHRDARTNVDVIVEKWLNDEEYKAAKEKFELAWQDASPASTPEKAPVSVKQEELPSSGGKRLLWGGPPPSPVKGRSSVRSASSGVQNPFDLAPSNAGRRVASGQLLLNNKIESPKLRNSKSFSKWEKQDLEASSLKKMRARMEKQKAETAAAAKPLAPTPAPTPLASMTNAQAQAPLIPPNVDPPKPVLPQLNAQATSPSVNLFAKPEASTPAAPSLSFSLGKPSITPSSSNAQPAPAVTAAPQNSASSVPAIQAASKPSFSFGTTPASVQIPSSAPDQSNTQKPSFTFGTPGAGAFSPSAPNAPATASKPSPFAPPSTNATKNEVSQPTLTFGPGTGPLPSSQSGKSGVPNFFAKPASQALSTGTTAPVSASTNRGPFNSGLQPAQANLPAKPQFQFGMTGGGASAAPSSSGGTPSLLSRLGTTQGSSQSPQPNAGQNQWSTPLGGGQTTSPSVPFGKSNPISGQPLSSNPFGPQQSQPSQPPSSNPFGQKQEQGLPHSANKSMLFGAAPSSGSEAAKSNPFGAPSSSTMGGISSSNPFGQKQEQGLQLSATKPTVFGTGPSSSSELTKSSPFGAPSSSATGGPSSFLPFSKPSTQPVALTQPATSAFSFPAAQPGQQQPTQSKPSFSFSFGNTNAPGSSSQAPPATTGTPAANPFNPAPATSTTAQAQPGGFSFNFGQPSAQSSTQSPFSAFAPKPADSEKK